MSLTSIGIASDGLLDRGDFPTLHIAVRGLLRDGEGGVIPPTPEDGVKFYSSVNIQEPERKKITDPALVAHNNKVVMLCIKAFLEALDNG